MSRVQRPIRRHPSRVYWVRRVLVLTVAVVMTVALGWGVSYSLTAFRTAAGSSGGTTPPGATSTGSPSTTDTTRQGQSPPTTHRKHGVRDHRSTKGDANGGKHTRHRKSQGVVSAGDCQPDQVSMAISVGSDKTHHAVAMTFAFASVGVSACTLSITPTALAIAIDHGPYVIWSSDQCPNTILAKQMVIQETRPTDYTFSWNGHRSTPDCIGTGVAATAGTYLVQAAFIGGEVSSKQFTLS